jgi:hypothetical protein
MMPIGETTALREQLVQALHGGGAHLDSSDVFGPVQEKHWGALINGAPHTLWQLLEHIRFTLQDLYEFSTNERYAAPNWPRDYWPENKAPDSPGAAKTAVAALEKAVEDMVALLENAETDLFAEIVWAEDGQTILHEALLAIDHTSYHLGQALFLRKQLEAAGAK